MTDDGYCRIRSHCICGASFDGSSNPPQHIRGVHAAWRSIHSGEGHGGCDARTARNARRRQERAWLREDREANR